MAKEGTFQWGTDFSVPEYTNWNSGQPSGGIIENCVVLWNEGHFGWEDVDCVINFTHFNIHALCEKLSDDY